MDILAAPPFGRVMRTAASLFAAAILTACGPGGEGGEHPSAYISRAEVIEAVTLLSAARTPVLQHYQMSGRWPTDSELERMAPGVRSGDGHELQMEVGERFARGTLAMRYDQGRWTCIAYDIPDAALPPNCRAGSN